MTEKEKFEILVNGGEIKCFPVPTAKGSMYGYIRFNKVGDLVRGITELDSKGNIISKADRAVEDPYPIYDEKV